ncbi:LysM peptidoglycan-binding domain-containing protein [Pseudoduganella sp. SL102]|uniref:LysM peptidoglycan-binding domain-containing protein n=1 Tax=Pseudoduganella sp. SL102 TaxID=2995154 RepID=UPI00248D0BA5|nr:LysM peptidoglycan-binding domain-containing protein [Pseudoduganella sp. SL102]WBS01375.1 LysM peptidoglycan-binding domain-containing protein [Pseudoduganella sp. SL102]
MSKAGALTKQSPGKSKYERWQATVDDAVRDARWHEYDCDIQRTVTTFNRHLTGSGYVPLDWRIVKAMIWTESGGPKNPAWKSNPMQIGNEGDPGLRALLFGNEGGELIMPATLRQQLTITSVASTPRKNIEAGTAYLLMRHARYDIRTVRQVDDTRIHTVEVRAGDSLDKIARQNDTTIEILKQRNASSAVLRPGQTLQYQKGRLRKAIVGWELITPASIARRYNVGDSEYSRKLNYCLEVMRRSKPGEPACE